MRELNSMEVTAVSGGRGGGGAGGDRGQGASSSHGTSASNSKGTSSSNKHRARPQSN